MCPAHDCFPHTVLTCCRSPINIRWVLVCTHVHEKAYSITCNLCNTHSSWKDPPDFQGDFLGLGGQGASVGAAFFSIFPGILITVHWMLDTYEGLNMHADTDENVCMQLPPSRDT